MRKWAQCSKTYAIMHSVSAGKKESIRKGLGIPVILLGAITASSIFSTTEKQEWWWACINGGLALTLTALSGVSNFLDLEKSITGHKQAGVRYNELVLQMECMRSREAEQREDPIPFMESMRKGMCDIRKDMISVSSSVIHTYMNRFDKTLVNTYVSVNRPGLESGADCITNVDVNEEANVEIVKCCERLAPV